MDGKAGGFINFAVLAIAKQTGFASKNSTYVLLLVGICYFELPRQGFAGIKKAQVKNT